MGGLLLVVLLAAPPAPVTFEALRAQALKAYGAKDYARACPLYARAAALRPEDAAVHADWGLCLAKQGNAQEARRLGAAARCTRAASSGTARGRT